MEVLILIATVIGCVLFGELIAGFVHWSEDSYGSPSWPIIGRSLIQPNMLHHFDPAHMTKHGYVYTVAGPMIAALAVMAVAFAFGWLTWQLVLVAMVAANANEFHKWSHRPARENPAIVRALQRIGLVQPTKHHALHHGGPKNIRYCTVTVYLNPVLDTIKFWRGLELAIRVITGFAKRPDLSLLPRAMWRVPVCTARACAAHA